MSDDGESAVPHVPEPQFKIQFAAGADFVRKLEEARAILSSCWRQSASLEQVLETALDAVFTRDGGRCSYVGAGGTRCGSRHDLHVDHIEPFARGGSATPEDLRLLCAPHNHLEAERVYGSDWMQRYRGGGAA